MRRVPTFEQLFGHRKRVVVDQRGVSLSRGGPKLRLATANTR